MLEEVTQEDIGSWWLWGTLTATCFFLVLGDTKYQVSIQPIPGSGMVVLNTEIGIVRYQILPHGHSFNICHIWTLGFLSWKPICKWTCLKPANVNMLLSLNKDLLMSRLASYWFQKGVEVLVSVSILVNTSTKVLGIDRYRYRYLNLLLKSILTNLCWGTATYLH